MTTANPALLTGRITAVENVCSAVAGGFVAGGVAVRYGRHCLSYADLAGRAARLAAHLRGRGAGPGVPIGILLPRGVAYAVALLGVLQAGAAVVPFELTHPAHRRRLLLAASGVEHAIVDSSLTDDPGVAEVVDLDDPATWTAPARRWQPPRADDPAYTLFTSGSTGAPKGVRMPHRALANLLAWQRRTSVAGAGTRTLQFAPLTFDVSLQEILATWSSGGELVIVDERRRHDVEYVARLCARAGIGRLFLPFAALQPIADWVATARLALPALTEVITAGEQPLVTGALEGFLRGCAPDVRLANQYGPTETHVVTAAVYTGDPSRWPRRPHAGTPIDNCTVAILDGAGDLASAGTEGEVCVTGAPTGLGYLDGGPGFGPIPALGGRYGYRTGDRGRIAEGVLSLLGRHDDQVKIGGQRIELAEVEAAAAAVVPARELAAVAAGRAGGRHLALFLVPGVAAIDPDAVRAALAERLAGAAVPSRVELLDRLPRTPSGKVDRRRLGQTPPATRRGTGPEATDAATIARVLADVLGVSTLDLGDSFLARGGTSLQAMLAVARLTRAVHATPPIDQILSPATVADLAAGLRAGRWSPLPGGVARPAPAGPLAPTRIQQELWAATELGDPTAYNVVLALEADRPVDLAALRGALRRTVARHPALRTLLVIDRGEPVLRFPPDWAVDVASAPAPDAAAADRLETAFAERAYDVGTEIPVRAMVIRLPGRDRILLGLHHHAVDEDSLRTVLADLARYYRVPPGATREAPPSVPRLIDDPGHLAYWTQALAGLDGRAVTWLQRTGGAPTGRAQHATVVLARAPRPPAGVTLYGWLLATLAHAARDGGAPAELVVGAVSSRRDPVADAGAVGCYTGLLPLRLVPADSLTRTAERAHRRVLAALRHRQFAYSDLGQPVVAATLSVERGDGATVRLGPARTRLRSVRPAGTPFPLCAVLRRDAGLRTRLEVTFDAGLYPGPTVHRLLAAWQHHLSSRPG